MNKRRKRKVRIRYLRVGVAVFLLVLIITAITMLERCSGTVPAAEKESVQEITVTTSVELTTEITVTKTDVVSETIEEKAVPVFVYPNKTKNSEVLAEYFDTANAVLFDAYTGEIIASRDEKEMMYPASLTKVMTLIVVLERTEDLSEEVLITEDMVYPMQAVLAQMAGLVIGEIYTVEELCYAMILQSGADAAMALALHTAGSEEEFAELMNRKAQEMGLTGTHFVNPVGLFDYDHYSTAADMGAILSYAVNNDRCRKIISAERYTIPPSDLDPYGIELESTLFSRIYGNEVPGVQILGGKTGFINEAGYCVESFAEVNGKTYILVLCNSTSYWSAVYNSLSAYSVYCGGGETDELPY